jgi:hypothetical protein
MTADAHGRLPWPWRLALLLPLLAVGVGYRLAHITEWPTVFHPMLQYENAVTTRVIWLKMPGHALGADEAAWLSHWDGRYKAPPVLETLTALSYLPDGTERVWVSALLTSLVWLGGTWFVYDLARRVSGSDLGAVLAAGFYLVTPFGIAVSRSFQHEALMVAAGLAGLWVIVRVRAADSLRRSILAGLACGLLGAAKPGIFLFVLGAGYFGLALGTRGLRRTLLSLSLWTFAALLALPSVAYAFFFLRGEAHQILPHLLFEPEFYSGWAARLQDVMGWPVLVLAVVGAALSVRRGGPLALFAPALLLGYACYALVFTYATATHNYYMVPLLPVTAICLGALVSARTEAVFWRRARPLARCLVVGAVAVLAFFYASTAWRRLHQEPDEALAARYAEAGRIVGHGSPVLSLTGHYGFSLSYHGWVVAHHWGYVMDRPVLKTFYGRDRADTDRQLTWMIDTLHPTHFVITQADEWDKQPELRRALNARFAVCYKDADDDTHVRLLIYDLRSPKDAHEAAGGSAGGPR